MNTGSRVPARFTACMTRPGMEPMYVRRCPRTSASSCMPPRLILVNVRPRALAMLCPREVLPTPGGPMKQRMAPMARQVRERIASAIGIPADHVMVSASHKNESGRLFFLD